MRSRDKSNQLNDCSLTAMNGTTASCKTDDHSRGSTIERAGDEVNRLNLLKGVAPTPQTHVVMHSVVVSSRKEGGGSLIPEFSLKTSKN